MLLLKQDEYFEVDISLRPRLGEIESPTTSSLRTAVGCSFSYSSEDLEFSASEIDYFELQKANHVLMIPTGL